MKIGLVLEGGAARGVFTAGVLDYWMEQGLSFPYMIGVSIGACNAMDYISGQIGRTRDCMIHTDKKYAYCGMGTFLRKGHLFDLDKPFDAFPNRDFPFDYDAYFASGIEREYVCSNCETGMPEYLADDGKSRERLMLVGRASSALPGAAPVVFIGGVPYVDGGITDSIPVRRAFEKGCDKVVVVQTRRSSFRMTPSKTAKAIARMHKEYPRMGESLLNRPQMYNRTLADIRRWEKEGKVFSIRPEQPEVRRMERGYHTLMRFYAHGYWLARKLYPELLAFMDSPSD